MEQKHSKASRAGGAIIAFSIIGGAVIGSHFGQPSVGIVIGIAAGVAISLALYLYDRKRG